MTFEHEISAYFVEVESSYSCGMDGILAPAGSLLGLDVSAKINLNNSNKTYSSCTCNAARPLIAIHSSSHNSRDRQHFFNYHFCHQLAACCLIWNYQCTVIMKHKALNGLNCSPEALFNGLIFYLTLLLYHHNHPAIITAIGEQFSSLYLFGISENRELAVLSWDYRDARLTWCKVKVFQDDITQV